jgi:hypothetical protein
VLRHCTRTSYVVLSAPCCCTRRTRTSCHSSSGSAKRHLEVEQRLPARPVLEHARRPVLREELRVEAADLDLAEVRVRHGVHGLKPSPPFSRSSQISASSWSRSPSPFSSRKMPPFHSSSPYQIEP